MKSRHCPWDFTVISSIVWCLHSSCPSFSDREQKGNGKFLLPVNKCTNRPITQSPVLQLVVVFFFFYLSQSSRQTTAACSAVESAGSRSLRSSWARAAGDCWPRPARWGGTDSIWHKRQLAQTNPVSLRVFDRRWDLKVHLQPKPRWPHLNSKLRGINVFLAATRLYVFNLFPS